MTASRSGKDPFYFSTIFARIILNLSLISYLIQLIFIDLFLFFFSFFLFALIIHIPPSPSCAIAAPLRARAIMVLPKWICAETKVMHERGKNSREFCPQSIQLNIDQLNRSCSSIVHISPRRWFGQNDRNISFFFFLTLYRHNRSNYCGSTNTWESVQTKTNLINIFSKIKIIKYRLLRVKQSWIKGCVKMEQIYRNWHLFYFIIHRITNTK